MCAVPIRKEYRNLQPSDLLPLFLSFTATSGLSERTISDYRKILQHFFAHHPDALSNSRADTLEYLARYSNPNSFNMRYAYLKCFWTG